MPFLHSPGEARVFRFVVRVEVVHGQFGRVANER